MSRRRLIGLLAALPAAGALGARLSHLVPNTLRRPSAAGSSTTRCAACGSGSHTMLAASCPASPRGLV